MAQYKADLRDVNFNLFDLLESQNYIEGYEANDLKDVVTQFDKFIENEIYPTRIPGDEEGVKLTKDGVKLPECFYPALKGYYENGWASLGYPEAIGGMPAPHALDCACTSLFVGANTALNLYTNLTRGALNVILGVGSQEQKDYYTPKMMDGTWGGTMCLTESGAGSDVGAVISTATPNKDGSYNIKGVKIFISSGENDFYKNIIHLVLAKTPGAPDSTKGLSLFIVPRYKLDQDGKSGATNGIFCTKIEEKMGIHGSATCELTLGADEDCVGHLLGDEFAGMQNMFLLMNEARLLCGIQGEAQASLAYELTLQYSRERSQFKTEIINLPDVKRTLIKMRAMSRGLRSLILYTANLFDKVKTDPSIEDEIAILTPICKAFASDEGFQVAVDAIQVHGGYGFCTEYGIEQFARDTKIASIYEGTNGIQGIDFVMRKILRDQGASFGVFIKKIMGTISRASGAGLDAELGQMGKSIEKGQAILELYSKYAAKKEVNKILSSTTDFQSFCSNIIVSWRLLESALKAKELLNVESVSGDEKLYLESKVDDFRVFCQHYLTRNAGISQSILNFDDLVADVVL